MNEEETTATENDLTFTDVLFVVLGVIVLAVISMLYPI